MGRYSYSNKKEADGLKKIQTWFLKKHGYFKTGCEFGTITWSHNGEGTGNIGMQAYISEEEQYIRLFYTQTDRFSEEKTDLDYKIPLISTPCYFGGKRYWFKCPWYANGIYCGRRVAVLYLSNKHFACRYCNNLTYNSKNLSGLFKVAGQVISEPYLEELRKQVKTKYYAGKITKTYRRFLIKERKAFFQLRTVAEGLQAHKQKSLTK